MLLIHRYFSPIVLVIFFILPGAKIFAQAASTPFSSFGIGESYGNSLVNGQGMAGVGLSQPQYWFLNNQNPALLVHNHITVFQAGIVLEQRTISGDTLKEVTKGGNMNYLATAFPLKRGKWGTAIGLMPHTTVNYKVVDPKGPINNSNRTVTEIEEGSGGLTEFYWANGVRVNQYLSLGLKATYLFGPIQKTYSNWLNDSTQTFVYIIPVEDKTYVKDFQFTTGLAFTKDSITTKNYRFSFGLVYGWGARLNAKRTEKIRRSDAGGNIYETITLDSLQDKMYLPPSLGIGVAWGKGSKWSLGFDYYYRDWSKFKNVGGDAEGLRKSNRMALGGEITPDAFSTENYIKRITYRMGLSLEKYPFLANNKEVKDFGINFGLSLPAGRSSLDFAFKVGKRGNRSENILEENYYKVYFGITFNDQWFIKRKWN